MPRYPGHHCTPTQRTLYCTVITPYLSLATWSVRICVPTVFRCVGPGALAVLSVFGCVFCLLCPAPHFLLDRTHPEVEKKYQPLAIPPILRLDLLTVVNRLPTPLGERRLNGQSHSPSVRHCPTRELTVSTLSSRVCAWFAVDGGVTVVRAKSGGRSTVPTVGALPYGCRQFSLPVWRCDPRCSSTISRIPVSSGSHIIHVQEGACHRSAWFI